MRGSDWSVRIWRTVLCGALILLALPAVALADSAHFRIEAQPLSAALKEFAQQAHMQLLYEHTVVAGVTGNAVSGVLDKHRALERLLRNTGLEAVFTSANAATIRPNPGAAATHGRRITPEAGRPRERRSPAQSAPPAQADGAPGSAASRHDGQQDRRGASSGPQSRAPELTEIIVTATKRSEREGEVAGALTVFSSRMLLEQGYTSFKDFAGLTPGLQVMGSFGSGEPVIRGITSGADTGALVGIVVDGAPIGASSSLTSSGALDALDMDPIDFSQVEILKGPQGTLYGANTLAGLISYTLREPSLQEASALVRVGRSATEDGEPGYSARGAASLPLVRHELAVRVSAYRDVNGGFIDNATRGIANQNQADRWGGMATLLYRPTDALRVTVAGFFQNDDAVADKVIYDPKTRRPMNGNLAYDSYLYPTSDKRIRVGLATISYAMNFASLTSVTSYQRIATSDVINGTGGGLAAVLTILPAFGGQTLPPPGVVALGTGAEVRKFTQEVRLTSTSARRLRWLIGGYYSDEADRAYEPFVGRTATGAVVPALDPALYFRIPSTYREYSAFGDLTYRLWPSFTLTGGIRIGHIDQSYSQSFGGSDSLAYDTLLTLVGQSATPASIPVARSKQWITNYLATARYHVSPDTMIYARFATGFRPGGPNARVNGLPPAFQPDKTQDYELGTKSAFWAGRGALDLTGYYMKWSGILVPISAHSVSGLGNGGDARSYGVEADLMLRPARALTLDATVAESHAYIVRASSAAAGALAAGDPLPYDPRWSGSLSADYRVRAWGRWTADFGGTARFDGSRHSGFASSAQIPDYVLPSYSLLDLRAGLENARTDFTLYVDNVTNELAQLAATTSFGPTEITIERPRTIGATVTIHF